MRHAIIAVCALLGAGACQAKMDWAAFWPLGEPTSGAEAAKAEILAADRAFNAMAQTDGLEEAFVAYMDAADGILFRPGGAVVVGESAIRATFAAAPEHERLVWEPRDAEAAASGDLGYTWGVWRYYDGADAGAAPVASGKYVTIWRRNAAGEWRGAVDLGVSDAEPDVRPLVE